MAMNEIRQQARKSAAERVARLRQQRADLVKKQEDLSAKVMTALAERSPTRWRVPMPGAWRCTCWSMHSVRDVSSLGPILIAASKVAPTPSVCSVTGANVLIPKKYSGTFR